MLFGILKPPYLRATTTYECKTSMSDTSCYHKRKKLKVVWLQEWLGLDATFRVSGMSALHTLKIEGALVSCKAAVITSFPFLEVSALHLQSCLSTMESLKFEWAVLLHGSVTKVCKFYTWTFSQRHRECESLKLLPITFPQFAPVFNAAMAW